MRIFFWPCAQKNHIYVSDYPMLERVKFVCAVNVYASGTVGISKLYCDQLRYILVFKCECILSSQTFSEWKSCTKIVDLDKLAMASSLLISWLGDNLVKLDEEQCVEMVGKTTLLPSIDV